MLIRPPSAGATHFGPDEALAHFHLDTVEWPSVEHYGYDHAQNVARLALVILANEYPELNVSREQRVLWCAALFHDTGRTAPFGAEDPSHAQRSAALAEAYLRGDPLHGGDPDLRERVGRLIARHHEAPEEPLAKVLADADAIDSCRVLPNTAAGLAYFRERTKTLHTQWPTRERLRKYMVHRGW